MAKDKAPTKAQTINRLARKTRAELVTMARKCNIVPDGSHTKARLAELIYDAVKKEEKAARNAEKLKAAKKAAAAEAKANPVIAKEPEEVNLSPMVKPATYAIFSANLKVYGGIVGETIRGGKIRVVTGHGQRWEWPVEET